MVFSSLLFLFYFLPVVLAVYYIAVQLGRRPAHLVLTLLSYLFYGWANPAFVVLMFGSTVVDYICGLVMTGQLGRGRTSGQIPLLEPGGARSRGQRVALTVSIITNLSLLGFFKYFNFGMDTWNAVMGGMGLDSAVYDNFLRITLPLGISFYTFQSMSYSIDVFRGEARAIRNPLDFSCYVAMFPQLVAGPIIRFQEVAEQLRERTHTVEKFARGTAFFMLGMSKKVLLADPCGKIADECFGAAGLYALDAWVGAVGYAFQIYFDFSAYSDMAIGLGLMFGFVFPKNFDSPYRAASITEFWRRWHLSLSTWLRDYLYIPLGGNRGSSGRTYVNLMMVMLLGGLWHGSSWNFVIWGAIHGGMLAVERLMGRTSFYARLPRPVSVLITFLIVCIAWVFFRAPTLGDAFVYLGSMFGAGADHPAAAALAAGQAFTPYHLFTTQPPGVLVWAGPQTWDFTRNLTWPKTAAVIVCFTIALILLAATSFHPFIYFIF
ncbi:MAG: MBOAT family protein [Verrucomicrobia bacterium]|nr:MBOAT family protein [Verrucomicrobiota bacterium]